MGQLCLLEDDRRVLGRQDLEVGEEGGDCPQDQLGAHCALSSLL